MSASIAPSETTSPILATKLFAPRLRERRVRRDRLASMLDRAPGLILVSAPAGFGKTTFLADWIQRDGGLASWLSLEPTENEPHRFLRYVAGALGRLSTALEAAMAPYLQAPRFPAPEAVMLPLLDALGRLEEPAVLVIDDYHTVEDPMIHAFLEYWIEHLPPDFCLALSTRVDPPFSALSRWRGQGRLIEVRAEDLRFSEDESRAFLAEVMQLDLGPHQASTLQERTEGWVVGLQMAALSLRSHPDADSFVETFGGGHRFVLDYLSDEVLASQPDTVMDFLLRVALLGRFNANLCDAVLGRADSEEVLARLDAENLFLIPLDGDRGWFRFHHLFQDSLERQLVQQIDPTEQVKLRGRACDWLSREGFPDEAMAQALAAKDRERTLGVLARYAEPTLQQGDAATATRWFDQVPVEWVETQPNLALARALAFFFAVRWNDLESWAPRLRDLLVQDLDPATQGRALVLAACAATAGAEREMTIRLARQALKLLPRDDNLLRAVAASTLGASLFVAGEHDAAREALREASRCSRGRHDTLGLDAAASYYEGRLDLALGRSREAFARHRRTWARESAVEIPSPMSSFALLGQAEVHFEWGELDHAASLAQEAITVNRGCFPFNELRVRVLQLDIARAQRRLAEALEGVQALDDRIQHTLSRSWDTNSRIHRVQIQALRAILEDDAQAGADWNAWAASFGITDGDDDLASKLLPEEPVTRGITLAIRWMLWRHDTERAQRWIHQLRVVAEDRSWHRVLIESWLLEGMALESAGTDSSDAIRHAVELAEAGRFVQVLADEREWLRTLPAEVRAQAVVNIHPEFQERIAASWPRAAVVATISPSPQPSSDLPESLSPREIEVLREIASGSTNAAAGRALFISPSTVKKHLENIYGKLGVHNRVEAIQRAQALDLLRE